ncbi:hypothetical protein [Brassicibacter mesophilus]|uniref:hypothetical protein n=1 Tax=Brassicibacter mesophilus TaxID=745119 RepID=UPI003D250BC1
MKEIISGNGKVTIFYDDPFEDLLDQCDFEVQVQYNHISDLLDQTNDEIVETTKKIEELRVEIDLYTRLEKINRVRQMQNQLENLKEKLVETEEKYDVLEDMWTDMYFAVLGEEK